MLALDGGGIRGLLTLQVLDRLEQELRQRLEAGPGFRLCDFFDLIGGTSTGAIIAAGLVRGMSTSELIAFYREFGREAFTKRALIARWKSLYANDRCSGSSKTRSATRRPSSHSTCGHCFSP
jgi:patatin-like phospholipase/acyl hydrolase